MPRRSCSRDRPLRSKFKCLAGSRWSADHWCRTKRRDRKPQRLEFAKRHLPAVERSTVGRQNLAAAREGPNCVGASMCGNANRICVANRSPGPLDCRGSAAIGKFMLSGHLAALPRVNLWKRSGAKRGRCISRDGTVVTKRMLMSWKLCVASSYTLNEWTGDLVSAPKICPT